MIEIKRATDDGHSFWVLKHKNGMYLQVAPEANAPMGLLTFRSEAEAERFAEDNNLGPGFMPEFHKAETRQ